MQAVYWNYFFTRRGSDKRLKFDLSPFLFAFTSSTTPDLKANIVIKQEKNYLFWVGENSYLFLRTRGGDIMKTIDPSGLTYEEIERRLAQGESIGFASYVCCHAKYFAMVSTMYGPKAEDFAAFISELFERCGTGAVKMHVETFATSVSKAQTLNFPYVSSATVRVDRSNNLYDQITEFSGIQDPDDLEYIEVSLKPRKRRDITRTYRHFAESLEENGVDKYIIKAKEAAGKAAQFYYILGSGSVSDKLAGTKIDAEIFAQIINKMESNDILQEKVNELEAQPIYEERQIDIIDQFNDVGAWNNRFAATLPDRMED